jgi:hypothetical protein
MWALTPCAAVVEGMEKAAISTAMKNMTQPLLICSLTLHVDGKHLSARRVNCPDNRVLGTLLYRPVTAYLL